VMPGPQTTSVGIEPWCSGAIRLCKPAPGAAAEGER